MKRHIRRPMPYRRSSVGVPAPRQSSKSAALGLKHGFAFFALTITASCLALAKTLPPATLKSAPVLTLPVKCEVGRSCLVQKLVDHDVDPGRLDYRCGTLTTDGHDGVDIRLRTMNDMREGYAVVAAAAGQVLRTRDGEPDVSVHERVRVDGKDAGNGVVVDHGGGWETQYSHLRRNSILVKPGQRIAAGQTIGLIGMSGNSEFPHLHFSVRHDGKTIDPFTASSQGRPCNPSAAMEGSLWDRKAGDALRYVPTAVITAGFASSVPPKAVAQRSEVQPRLSRTAPVLLWVDVIGAKKGDIQKFSIDGPDGRPVHFEQLPVDTGGLSWFAYSGKRAPAGGWMAGRYTGRYTLSRNGTVVDKAEALVDIL